jgi:hypothetical protein
VGNVKTKRPKYKHLVSTNPRFFVCGAPRNKGSRPTTNPADPDGVCDDCKAGRPNRNYGSATTFPPLEPPRSKSRAARGSVKTIVQSAMTGWLEKATRLEVTAVVASPASYLNVRARAGEATLMTLNLEGLSPGAVGAALRAVANALDG